MKNNFIYVKPLQEYTTVSVTNKVYTFVPEELYKYYPEYGTIDTCYGQLWLGSDYKKYFEHANTFEILLHKLTL